MPEVPRAGSGDAPASDPGEPGDPRSYDAAGGSEVGRVRRENQDAWVDARHPTAPMRLLLTADGMGGHRGGQEAARLAVQGALRVFEAARQPSEELARAILEQANREIQVQSLARADLAGMGSTAVALLVGSGGRAFASHVGDSRLYRLREGALEQLTEDHSLVAALVRAGRIAPQEARTHPRRNQLERALGVEPRVRVEVRSLDARPGDVFLLCSDGLWGALDEGSLALELGAGRSEEVVGRLLRRGVEEDGSDNVTAQVLKVAGPDR